MSELYKGYTQHLVCDAGNDVDPRLRINNMVPGLYLMRLIEQEGYVLPVCKYIQNFRYDVLGTYPVLNEQSSHPRYDYAEFEGCIPRLVNTLTIPTVIAGGLVVITNIMESTRVPRYSSLTDSNMSDLIEAGALEEVYKVLRTNFETMEHPSEGFIFKVKKSCILETERLKYTFEFTSKDGIYTDFVATLKEK